MNCDKYLFICGSIKFQWKTDSTSQRLIEIIAYIISKTKKLKKVIKLLDEEMMIIGYFKTDALKILYKFKSVLYSENKEGKISNKRVNNWRIYSEYERKKMNNSGFDLCLLSEIYSSFDGNAGLEVGKMYHETFQHFQEGIALIFKILSSVDNLERNCFVCSSVNCVKKSDNKILCDCGARYCSKKCKLRDIRHSKFCYKSKIEIEKMIEEEDEIIEYSQQEINHIFDRMEDDDYASLKFNYERSFLIKKKKKDRRYVEMELKDLCFYCSRSYIDRLEEDKKEDFRRNYRNRNKKKKNNSYLGKKRGKRKIFWLEHFCV